MGEFKYLLKLKENKEKEENFCQYNFVVNFCQYNFVVIIYFMPKVLAVS